MNCKAYIFLNYTIPYIHEVTEKWSIETTTATTTTKPQQQQ